MKQTTNYKLNMPEVNESVDINVLNSNMETLDNVIKPIDNNVKGLLDVEKTIATKSEAESGSVNNKYMTPLRTKEAITKLSPKVEIVDNLTDGGRDKALSAEQGKVLFQSGIERNQELVANLNSKKVQATTDDSLKTNIAKVNDIKVGDYSVGDEINVNNLNWEVEGDTIDITLPTELSTTESRLNVKFDYTRELIIIGKGGVSGSTTAYNFDGTVEWEVRLNSTKIVITMDYVYIFSYSSKITVLNIADGTKVTEISTSPASSGDSYLIGLSNNDCIYIRYNSSGNRDIIAIYKDVWSAQVIGEIPSQNTICGGDVRDDNLINAVILRGQNNSQYRLISKNSLGKYVLNSQNLSISTSIDKLGVLENNIMICMETGREWFILYDIENFVELSQGVMRGRVGTWDDRLENEINIGVSFRNSILKYNATPNILLSKNISPNLLTFTPIDGTPSMDSRIMVHTKGIIILPDAKYKITGGKN